MDWKTLKSQADNIDRQIWELESQKRNILLQDPDYAAYAERRDMQRESEFMTIDAFHYWLDTLRAIEEGAPSDPAQAQKYWREHRAEYQRATGYLLL